MKHGLLHIQCMATQNIFLASNYNVDVLDFTQLSVNQ